MDRLETFPDGGIEGGILGEPPRLPGPAPKGDDSVRLNGA
jgi:hypothetical protein